MVVFTALGPFGRPPGGAVVSLVGVNGPVVFVSERTARLLEPQVRRLLSIARVQGDAVLATDCVGLLELARYATERSEAYRRETSGGEVAMLDAMTTSEVAQLARTSSRNVLARAKCGTLRSVQLPDRSRRYERADVEQWIKARAQ